MSWRKIFRRRRFKARQFRKMGYQQVFETIFRHNLWQGTESVSGHGSDRGQTQSLVDALPRLLQRIDAHSLLDIPCGDFHWMQEVDLDGIQYIGADIVNDLVLKNRPHETENRLFITADLIDGELPPVDMIFCRDCLVHFCDAHVWKALDNVVRHAPRYLATTTFTERQENRPIVTGQWRPLNLQAAPFNLPAPMQLIDEGCTHDKGQYRDKMLGVWRVDEIAEALPRTRQAA